MSMSRDDLATATHQVAIVVLPEVVPLDLAVPLQVFGPWPDYLIADEPRLVNPYSVVLCGPEPEATSATWLAVPEIRPITALRAADTVIVPGCQDPQRPVPEEVYAELRAAATRGARIVSICIGAFVLAAAGVLDGRKVTTHWRWADDLRRRYPQVDVQEKYLYVEDGQVLTSAGVLAGADACLHVLRCDLGQSAANAVARFLVSPPHREGGQAQFIRQPLVAASGSFGATRQWLLADLREHQTLQAIADHARVSVRTLTRRFQAETGETVMNWLIRQRVVRARALLEDTDLPITAIAHDVGFGSAESLRAHFHAQIGTSPHRYRCTFRGAPAAT